jgi:hypothetical protein
MDAMSLASPQMLDEFVKSFGSNPDCLKGFFPNEAFNNTNYNEVLSKSEPFEHDEFYSTLKDSSITDEEYQIYLKEASKFETRWDYLKFYNVRDVESMISPIDNIIHMNWTYKIDTLLNLSLSANASSIKYALAYNDFDVHGDYNFDSDDKTFDLRYDNFKKKWDNYRNDDKKKKRNVAEPLNESIFKILSNMYNEQNKRCYICNARFTVSLNQPTLDRLDNSKGHTADNVKWCCEACNKYKSDRDEKISRLHIQLRNYALINNLPMTLSYQDEYAYHVLRAGITGGLSFVMHRMNLKGVTKINHFELEDGTVYSVNSDNIMTHVLGVDFNSLYPSAFSSNVNMNNPYTDHKMYMPGRILQTIMCNSDAKKNLAFAIIRKREDLFVAEIKGHIHQDHLNEFINFPPIFRNLEIVTDRETIGDFMYDYMESNHLKTDNKEKKLTMLLSTHNQFMSFSSYYLWFLIDRCHFIIDDIKSIITFTKHDRFNRFVNEFMNNRIDAINQKNKGKEQFCKTSLNGSYGYHGMNTEKYVRTSVKNKSQTFQAQIFDNFVSTRKLSEDQFLVTYNPRNFRCDTCIQEAFFTLDNAKFWYLNFVYNFMYRCLDMSKIHFIEGDTDSAYWAVAGSEDHDFRQRFDYVIQDETFYKEHIYEWLPNPSKDVYDEKKLLGLAIENQDENCIALAPKCYCLFPHKGITKMKGVKKSQNKMQHENYLEALTKPVGGKNTNLQVKNGIMSKIRIRKNALTGVHTKAFVLPNHSCCPFIENVKDHICL